jgi:hypothetical protein
MKIELWFGNFNSSGLIQEVFGVYNAVCKHYIRTLCDSKTMSRYECQFYLAIKDMHVKVESPSYPGGVSFESISSCFYQFLEGKFHVLQFLPFPE